MNEITIIGLVASVLTGASMLPQLIKLIKEKKAREISLVMLFVLISGLSCWIVYGVMKEDWILVGANSFSWLVTALIIIFSIKYK